MLKAEEVLILIKKGIKYQDKFKGNFSYINVENDILVCPFCNTQLKPIKFMSVYIQTCSCEKGKEYYEKINVLLETKIKIEDELNVLYKEIEEKAFKAFKLYYQKTIIPLMIKMQEIENTLIEELPSLDIREDLIEKYRNDLIKGK